MIPVDLESDDTALAREPQQARSRRTLEQLREAAWQLLENEGIEALTVVGVASGAGVSVGSFYARFEGKEELLDHLEAVALEASLRSWRDAAAEVETADLLAHLVHLYRRGPARRLLLLSRADGRSPERMNRLQEDVARALATTLETSPADPGADPQVNPRSAGSPELLRGAALAGAARELALAVDGPARRWLFSEDSMLGVDQRILDTLLGLAHQGRPDAGTLNAPGGPRASDSATATRPGAAPGAAPGPDPAPRPEPASEPEKPPEPDPPPVELFDVWG
jgi:AcrR family transcriptional regulator